MQQPPKNLSHSDDLTVILAGSTPSGDATNTPPPSLPPLPVGVPLPTSELHSLDEIQTTQLPAAEARMHSEERIRRESELHPSNPRSVRPYPQQTAAKKPFAAKLGLAPLTDEELAEEHAGLKWHLVHDSPPWLVSAIAHMLVLIILGLWLLASDTTEPLVLEIDYAEKLGDQLDEENFATEDDANELEQMITPDSLLSVEDPLASPQMQEDSALARNLISPIKPEVIGAAFKGRTKGMKNALRAAYGGNASTQQAVENGLKWLARYQRKNGMWSLSGPYKDGVTGIVNDEAATAMALLAFQGDGHLHNGPESDPYTIVVRRAWNALLKRQADNGSFFNERKGENIHRFYTQAQCCIAICELYAMTRDETLRKPAQKGIDYLVATQTRRGGWRYEPKSGEDTSVTGWVVMALKSAQMAGIEVPSDTFQKLNNYFDRVSHENGSRYSYRPSELPRLSMTAEGLLCRQYLGWHRDDPRLQKGVKRLVANRIDWNEMNVYYWYYATQVCHHMEGKEWRAWNSVMRQVIPSKQVKIGRERGSWAPHGDRMGNAGGRLYVTCLSIYMMEVYYRHLPIYRQELILSE